jgi:hypothetical protein
MKICGIDASPHSTGLVKFTLDSDLNILEIERLGFFGYTEPKKKKDWVIPSFKNIISYDEAKYDFYNRTIMMMEHIWPFIADCEYVCQENYGMAGQGLVFQIADFSSQIKFQALRNSSKLRLIEPLTLKMFATNSGKAQKPEMFDAFVSDSNSHLLVLSDLPQIKVHQKGQFAGLRNKDGISPLSDIVDSFWLGILLIEELQIRKGTKQLSDLVPHHAHILSRKTKANPIPIYQKAFIEKN